MGERQAPIPSSDPARAAALAAKEVELAAVLATVRTAFAILGSRALVILAALGGAGAIAWALVAPDALRLTAAFLWLAMVFWPALWIDRRGG